MEYRVRVWSAVEGNVVALVSVAEAMAKRAASGYGTLPLHGPTLKNLRPERVRLLWDAAMCGELTVCDNQGHVATATALIGTERASIAEFAGAASSASITAENTLHYLFARQQDLIKWGETSGDLFLFVETPGTLVNSDLRNFTEAGFGEVIKAGYHRSAEGGGESEPWRDDLYDTAPCATKPAQSSAATPAPVADDKVKTKSNETPKTLKFNAEVLRLMTKFWDDKPPNTKPFKNKLSKMVYDEMLRGTVRSERGISLGSVEKAAKKWPMPIVLSAYVPEATYAEKQHPFKR